MSEKSTLKSEVQKVKSGTIFSETRIANAFVKERFPNAVFVPCCALGCYYGVYEDATYNVHVADYNYLQAEDVIPRNCPPPSPFGVYFKLIWKR
jgi:hypothetical protein